MTEKLLKSLKDYYDDDKHGIIRKLQDILNIPYDEALKLIK